MSTCPDIPPECRTLIACLRGAVNGQPPDRELASADWRAVSRQAREHGVDTYLYPWLAAHVPDLFSIRTAVAADSAPAAWRAAFFDALPRSVQRKRQLAELLAACANARIDVIPLKGAWLSEAVYDDPAQRSMTDLDLLIRAGDRDACHALFLTLGYTAKADTLHNVYACDQSYRHPAHPLCVELHWHVASILVRDAPIPDIAAIWENTSAAVCCGQPVRLFSPADQVAHLTQHILHHLFAVPLRGHLDIALYLRKHGSRVTVDALASAARRWKTGRATPFILSLASELLAAPLPLALQSLSTGLDEGRLAQAGQIIFDLPAARSCAGETTLLRFKHASALGRLGLVLNRIFMPRAFLLLHYPSARHRYGLPYAWLRRALDLRRQNRERIRALLCSGTPEAGTLANAERRVDLVNWLLCRSPSQGTRTGQNPGS